MAESVCTCVRIAGDGVRKGENSAAIRAEHRWITSVPVEVSPHAQLKV